ncbi:MAG: hypothetical protein ACRDL2_15540 [Gaiellaceae bacterium]
MLDTGKLRRDDRLAAVAAAASTYGTLLAQAANGMLVVLQTELPIARGALELAIETAGDELPETRKLLTSLDTSSNAQAIMSAAGAALAEIAARRTSLKDSRSV